MKPNGKIFYQDEYSQQYQVDWQTVNGVIDITSTVGQPYIWGKPPAGFMRDGTLFRRGVVTITRQVLRLFDGGYEVVAEGASQFEDDIQMNFPGHTGPTDPFRYHLDRPLVDDIEIVVVDGPHWAIPGSAIDMAWGDLDSAGNPASVTVGAVFEFIDVWS